jgi:hypothetical protein
MSWKSAPRYSASPTPDQRQDAASLGSSVPREITRHSSGTPHQRLMIRRQPEQAAGAFDEAREAITHANAAYEDAEGIIDATHRERQRSRRDRQDLGGGAVAD